VEQLKSKGGFAVYTIFEP